MITSSTCPAGLYVFIGLGDSEVQVSKMWSVLFQQLCTSWPRLKPKAQQAHPQCSGFHKISMLSASPTTAVGFCNNLTLVQAVNGSTAQNAIKSKKIISYCRNLTWYTANSCGLQCFLTSDHRHLLVRSARSAFAKTLKSLTTGKHLNSSFFLPMA